MIYSLVILALSLLSSICLAQTERPLILHPKVNAPIQQVYSAIIEGVKTVMPLSDTLVIDDSMPVSQLEATLNSIQPTKIIALGRMPAEKVAQSRYREQLLVAGTLFDASEFEGVSLAIDSRVLVSELKTLLPSIKRVFVFGAPTRSSIFVHPESLIGQPLMISRHHEDPLINTRALWQLLAHEASTTDAILLPSQLDRDILFELVQLAWEKRIILLSTNLAHLKEGVLMVFYPDNAGMGRQIGTLAANPKAQRYESLTQIQIAVNTSVATHLRIDITPKDLRCIQLQVK
ncbi:hypothetical protein GO003_021290 [Methylicorpusculum oleiharenae]|uniref:hypothetical protein n=1 Tax=Methylicorpusculum oleiharenae TaxID=1338687 RepID=UPI001356F79D|nr:hypothetical protein [Methylicorpusculum oleiharenae]MCD2452920.1 hypothetical protein [Methylicorpusculum oleiharenae]